MKKFTENDIFVNTLKVYPKIRFFAHSGSIYYNNSTDNGVKLNDFLLGLSDNSAIPEGSILSEEASALLTEDAEYIIIE